jgi:Helix-turn-helix of insertion element transposase
MIDVSALNNLDGNGSAHGITTRVLAEVATTPVLSPRRLKALNCLLAKADGDSMATVAASAGVHVRTLFNYMADQQFYAEYRRMCNELYKAHHVEVTKAHIKGCLRHGPAQAQLIKLYYDRVGDPVVEHTENVNKNGDLNLDELPISIDAKRHIVEILGACQSGAPLPECCRPHVRLPGTVQAQTPALPPEMKLCTPLDEVELRQHEAPCDS